MSATGRVRWVGILLFAASLGSPAIAQGEVAPCDRSKTLYECWDALTSPQEAAQKLDVAKSVDQIKGQVQKKSSAATDPNSTSSMLNLLPSLFGALGFDGLTSTEGNLNLDKVFQLGGGWRLDLGGTAYGSADLFEPLVKALPESVSSETKATLKGEIGDFDKTDFRIRLSPQWGADSTDRRWIGRDPTEYSDLLTQWYAAAIHEAFKVDSFTAWRQGLRPEEEAWEKVVGEDAPSLTEVPLREISARFGDRRPEVLDQLESDLVTQAQAFKASLTALDSSMERVDDLVANQPQLILEGSYHERRNLTGVEEWSGKVSYEIGLFGNLNDLKTWGKNNRSKCPDDETSYDCLQAYLRTRQGGKKKLADNGNRLAISLEYTHSDPFHFELPDQDFTFDLASSQTWAGSLTYGRYLGNFKLPNLLGTLHADQVILEDSARFDLEAKYDDASGDPMKQSRFTATATFSQKASDQSTYSLSLAYANKSEYLGEVNHELSANLALKWGKDKPSGE